jgi:hypothetical protein
MGEGQTVRIFHWPRQVASLVAWHASGQLIKLAIVVGRMGAWGFGWTLVVQRWPQDGSVFFKWSLDGEGHDSQERK